MYNLNEATKNWIKVPNLDEIYDDEVGRFTNYELKGKARLPKLFEINEVYQNFAAGICPDWMVNYLEADSKYLNRHVVEGVSGYWTLSSTGHIDRAFSIEFGGKTGYTRTTSKLGIRPVITLKKSSLVN